MKTRAEERWERMQELLAREAAGHDGPVKISSQRPLFGIKSHVEEVIERVAAEDEQRCMDAIDAQEARGTSPASSALSANRAQLSPVDTIAPEVRPASAALNDPDASRVLSDDRNEPHDRKDPHE